MNLLFIGDIIGKAGRDVVAAQLPRLRDRLKLDFVIANGENAAGGFGITRAIAEEFYGVGIDVISTGNHWADQKEILTLIEADDRIIRPLNYPKGTPGRGANLYQTPAGSVLVMNVMGRVFMDALDDPFAAVDAELNACPLGEAADVVVVDMHAEASSEKRWRWVISAMAAPVLSWAPTPMCPRAMRRYCPAAPPTRPMPAAAATTTA